MMQDGEHVNIGPAHDMRRTLVRASIPPLSWCNRELDLRRLLLRPRLEVGRRLHFDCDARFRTQVDRVPLGSDGIRVDAESMGDQVLCHDAAERVPGQVGERPPPERQHVKSQRPPRQVEGLGTRPLRDLDSAIRGHIRRVSYSLSGERSEGHVNVVCWSLSCAARA